MVSLLGDIITVTSLQVTSLQASSSVMRLRALTYGLEARS
jgi:hypothetical protein